LLASRNRYTRLQELRRLDPERDHHAIYRASALYEFPFDTRLGLLLAFWRTFAVPSIAELLDDTGETTKRTRKRADDTGILMFELIDHGPDDARGRTAIRRLNQIHRRFAITNEEYLYVLGTFIFVPTRWIDRHGWRPLCCHERAASFHFYRELGRRMNIKEIPASYADFQTFFDDFERARFGYSPAGARLILATKDLLATLPAPLVPAGRALADALLDPTVRHATGVAEPTRLTTTALRAALAARGWWLRHQRPRQLSRFADGIDTRTYPDGYDLAEVGTAAASHSGHDEPAP
jgi:hypothetical protein